jgi:hypothetical protein
LKSEAIKTIEETYSQTTELTAPTTTLLNSLHQQALSFSIGARFSDLTLINKNECLQFLGNI